MHDTLDTVDLTIGVTAGVSCYKALLLCRYAQKKGWSCRFVMTPKAAALLSPTLCQAISHHTVFVEGNEQNVRHAMPHIALARATQRIIIYPATQNSLAILRCGLSRHLLHQLCLARDTSRVPLFIAPAMNAHMWHEPATQDNMATLIRYGAFVLGPDEGEQACGEEGMGRLIAPEEAFSYMAYPPQQIPLPFRSALVTAGPTRTMIDPVRCLQNLSSGKMGFALAAALARHGVKVMLIHGPTHCQPTCGVKTQAVSTTEEMCDAVTAIAHDYDVFIANAAPTDFSLREPFSDKIQKKDKSTLSLSFTPTPDILKTVSVSQHPRPYCVGFCLATSALSTQLHDKWMAKQLDLIFGCHVLSSIGQDEIQLSLYDGMIEEDWPRYPKEQAANLIIRAIAERYPNAHP